VSVLYLVRHGQASFHGDDYDVLSDVGREQARVVGAALAARAVTPGAIVSGGLQRHRETAREACDAAGWTVSVDVDPDWDEIDHVDVIGAHHPAYRSHAAIVTGLADDSAPSFEGMWTDALRRWVARDGVYAESHDDFQARVARAALRAGSSVASGRPVVVFTSGGPVTAVTAAALGLDNLGWGQLDPVIANASVTAFRAESDGFRLLTFNEVGHLQSADVLTQL